MPILQSISKTLVGRAAPYPVDHSLIQAKSHLKLGVFYLKNSSLGFATFSSIPKDRPGWSLRFHIDKPASKISCSPFMEEASFQQLKILNASREKSFEHISHDLNGRLQKDTCSDSSIHIISVGVSGKELDRRRNIGLANKGRTPWNKGIKHSEGMEIESCSILTSNQY